MLAHCWGSLGPFPLLRILSCCAPPHPHLVLLPAALLIVVEDVVPEIILQPLQKSLVPRLLPEAREEGHGQAEH